MEGNCQCNDWSPNPYAGMGIAATGAYLGKTALICGGERPKECYSLKPDSATVVAQMNFNRVEAASIIFEETRYLCILEYFTILSNKAKLSQQF